MAIYRRSIEITVSSKATSRTRHELKLGHLIVLHYKITCALDTPLLSCLKILHTIVFEVQFSDVAAARNSKHPMSLQFMLQGNTIYNQDSINCQMRGHLWLQRSLPFYICGSFTSKKTDNISPDKITTLGYVTSIRREPQCISKSLQSSIWLRFYTFSQHRFLLLCSLKEDYMLYFCLQES